GTGAETRSMLRRCTPDRPSPPKDCDCRTSPAGFRLTRPAACPPAPRPRSPSPPENAPARLPTTARRLAGNSSALGLMAAEAVQRIERRPQGSWRQQHPATATARFLARRQRGEPCVEPGGEHARSDVSQVECLPDAVVVVAVTRVARHAEVVHQDHVLLPRRGNDPDLFGERKVLVPVRVEV